MREETDLRLGIEMDFVPGREDRIANVLDARDWDYVVGSVHFLRDHSLDTEDYSASGARASRPSGSGGATSRPSPSRPAPGSTTSSATPTW